MFNALILPISLYFINSLLSGLYSGMFLDSKSNQRITMGIWTLLYFFLQIVIYEMAARRYPIIDVVSIIVNIGILLALQMLLFKKNIARQFFVLFSFLAGKEVLKYIASIMYYVIVQLASDLFDKLWVSGFLSTKKQVDGFFAAEIIVITVFTALFYAVLLGTYLYIINKKFIRRDYIFSKPEYMFLILPAICALCVSVTIRMMIYSIEDGIPVFIYEKAPATLFWIPMVCFLLLLSVIITVVIFQNIIQYHDEILKSKVLENQMMQMQKEVSEIQEIYSDMRGLKHDMRSHLANIAAYITTGHGTESDEIRSYIGRMGEVIDKLDFSCQTGNPITDVIIHQKSNEAKKRQIQFTYDFVYPTGKQIDVYDVGVILNNALDNAIEACEKVNGERIIYLRSYEKGNLFFIEVENAFDGITLNTETGLPVSEKKDQKLHGYGLLNIEKSARKYMGDIDIEIKDEDVKLFCLTVMLGRACE